MGLVRFSGCDRQLDWNRRCSQSNLHTDTRVVKRIPDPPVVTAPTIATVNVAFTVSWTASSEATTYNLQGTESGTHNVTRTSYSGPNTSVVLTLGGMVDDDFQYAAQACNANGCSAWANASNSTYLQGQGGAK